MKTADAARSVRALEWMFNTYNTNYFGGRLPPYQIRLADRLQGVDGNGKIVGEAAAMCDTERRVIHIRTGVCQRGRFTAHRPDRDLIHEMIHASGIIGHGEEFAAEARRLKALGAPVYDKDCSVSASPTSE